MLTDGGKGVLYIKDSKLYKHNLKEKEKLASDVVGFIASENGKQIVYQDDESRLYFKSGIKDIINSFARCCSANIYQRKFQCRSEFFCVIQKVVLFILYRSAIRRTIATVQQTSRDK